MTAWYNEHDPYAAQWLRNLIAARLIAPGDVDERDIRDVTPQELARYDQCHFFAGIGTWSYALRPAGWPPGLDRQLSVPAVQRRRSRTWIRGRAASLARMVPSHRAVSPWRRVWRTGCKPGRP